MIELLQLALVAPAVGSLARSRTDLLPELALAVNTFFFAAHLIGSCDDLLWGWITAYQIAVLTKESRLARAGADWKPEALLVLFVWFLVATLRVAALLHPFLLAFVVWAEILAVVEKCYALRYDRLDARLAAARRAGPPVPRQPAGERGGGEEASTVDPGPPGPRPMPVRDVW